MDIGTIVAAAIPVILGVSFIWNKVEKVLKALKELGDVLSVGAKAFEDKKLSPEETAQIGKEYREAVAAFKAILK